jgi:hypothetical protein
MDTVGFNFNSANSELLANFASLSLLEEEKRQKKKDDKQSASAECEKPLPSPSGTTVTDEVPSSMMLPKAPGLPTPDKTSGASASSHGRKSTGESKASVDAQLQQMMDAAAKAKKDADHKEELRRINRAWNAKALDPQKADLEGDKASDVSVPDELTVEDPG